MTPVNYRLMSRSENKLIGSWVTRYESQGRGQKKGAAIAKQDLEGRDKMAEGSKEQGICSIMKMSNIQSCGLETRM